MTVRRDDAFATSATSATSAERPSVDAAALPVFEPVTNVYETAERFHVVAELPGVDQDAVDLVIDRNRLAIKATTAPATTDGLRGLHREYHDRKRFERWFVLPDSVDRAHVTATLKDGVLTLVLPKAEQAKPRRIEVTTG